MNAALSNAGLPTGLVAFDADCMQALRYLTPAQHTEVAAALKLQWQSWCERWGWRDADVFHTVTTPDSTADVIDHSRCRAWHHAMSGTHSLPLALPWALVLPMCFDSPAQALMRALNTDKNVHDNSSAVPLEAAICDALGEWAGALDTLLGIRSGLAVPTSDGRDNALPDHHNWQAVDLPAKRLGSTAACYELQARMGTAPLSSLTLYLSATSIDRLLSTHHGLQSAAPNGPATAAVPLVSLPVALHGHPLCVSAFLAPVELTLAQLQTLAVGSVLRLDHRLDQALQVHVTDSAAPVAVLSAALGSYQGHRSLALRRANANADATAHPHPSQTLPSTP